ncbi:MULTISPECIES: hypothetical protein [unclassified Rhodococcus (in: high G+C Gram-positive bacteria)]|uniref:hypothetical protein n=1 Tax=unclassified Rhodococcus (in: high G+C Gram-positive bacteria) TaxID=192944 RepID=UPI00146D89F7|nr:hypothetical protein [Rhodococcus sp. BL-253-APC-6A1W]NMD94947.1 hypothetical protein [Rhodococcus sp. BL-253-APC-6A1W]
MSAVLEVIDNGTVIGFGVDDIMKYHGPGFPGGVAHAVKVLERALPVLSPDAPAERREISAVTAHRGPGVRDTFEAVTRGVTEGRFTVDPALERPERGATLERYVFELTYRGKTVRLEIREGFVTDEFISLGRKADRTRAEDERLTVLKQEMADRLLSAPADEVYDIVG